MLLCSLGSFVLVWMVFLVFSLLLLYGFFLVRIWYGIFLLFHPLCLACFGVHLCLYVLVLHRPSIGGTPPPPPSTVRFPIWVVPIFSFSFSLAISSIRLAYSITDSTPPCLMMSLICMVLVFPYCVLIVAVRFLFICFSMFQSIPSSPLLYSAYRIAFSHALSYAFVTSRNAMHRSSFFCYVFFYYCVKYQEVVCCCFSSPPPPACASDMFTTLDILLFIIRLNSFPMLLPRVIPRSLLHFPFFSFSFVESYNFPFLPLVCYFLRVIYIV